ncbi:MAG: ATP-binding protein [Planctomycetota bacterium]|nr:ATP-binding protein [Planctomycetota bacterium]
MAEGTSRLECQRAPDASRLVAFFSPSGEDLRERIVAAAEVELLARGFKLKRVDQFKIALRELMENALEHGCRDRPEAVVRVECRIADREATMVVIDDGPGFDFQTTVKKEETVYLRPQNRGRGLLLVARIGRVVRFETNGGTRAEVVVAAEE